jgi:hypothetical protein
MKSQTLSFILTLLFGPLGCFYSSVGAGAGLTLAAVIFGGMTAGVGAILMWPINIFVGAACVASYNDKIKIEAKRHAQLLNAAKK